MVFSSHVGAGASTRQEGVAAGSVAFPKCSEALIKEFSCFSRLFSRKYDFSQC